MATVPEQVANLHPIFKDLLREAEQRFGPRDRSFRLSEITIGGRFPHLDFPGIPEDVVIRLGDAAIDRPLEALHQLAHETVHFLNPRPFGSASVLEEGLATYFELKCVRRHDPFFPGPPLGYENYSTACSLVEELLGIGSDAMIRLRDKGQSLSAVSAADIKALDPQQIEDRLANALACKFK